MRGGSRRRRRVVDVMHVVVMVMMVMVMMVMVMVVMMMVHLGRWGCGSGGRSVLRHRIAGEAERENGRSRKGLDHWRTFLWLDNPNGAPRTIAGAA